VFVRHQALKGSALRTYPAQDERTSKAARLDTQDEVEAPVLKADLASGGAYGVTKRGNWHVVNGDIERTVVLDIDRVATRNKLEGDLGDEMPGVVGEVAEGGGLIGEVEPFDDALVARAGLAASKST